MAHVFFFSYAHTNKDKDLESFFEDLCEEVKGPTTYAAKDPRVSFRDSNNLPLMDEWRPQLIEALQTSAVMVCVTSPAYFGSRFCGQEFYIFDQRRKAFRNNPPPPVILPVIWWPDPSARREVLDLVQWQQGEIDPLYEQRGLRYLRTMKPNEYERCVKMFGYAIGEAWRANPDINPLANVAAFADIPNAFAGGDSDEARGPQGYLPGPGIANFVFAAGLAQHFPLPLGRYGTRPSEWRPYLPPVGRTILDLARTVTNRQSLRFREIPIDQNLDAELNGARNRKNLTLVVADAQALPLPYCSPITVFDQESWEGTAVLMPWDGKAGPWDNQLHNVVGAFPVRSQASAPPFQAPIQTATDFENTLDLTLTELQSAVIAVGANKKEKTDRGPATLAGPGGGTS
jgi:hypothetical protein